MEDTNKFYVITKHDTWATISHKVFGDVRWWWVLVTLYSMSATEKLIPGKLLWVPSKEQVLSIILI